MSKSQKSALAFLQGDKTDYAERAAMMTAEERTAIIAVVSDKFKQLRDLAEQQKIIPVDGVNAAREIGRQIELFTQHDKLQQIQFNSLAVALPDASITFAKECLSLFRKFPEPVKDFAEAEESWKRIMVQLDLLPKSAREKQRAHPEEPIMDFLGVVIRATAEAVDLEKKLPLEEWPDFQRDSFEKQSQPIRDMHEKAKAIRLAKLKGAA